MTSVSTDRRFGVTGSVAIKTPCKTATTANITLEGEQTIDGVACVSGDRVLVKNQTTGSENGAYSCNTSAWRREPDWDGSRDVVEGTSIFVTDGSTTTGHWRVTTSDPIIPGTTSVTLEASDIDSTLRTDLGSTDTDDGTKGFHLVNYPPLAGEVGVVNYEYEWGDIDRRNPTGDGIDDDSAEFLSAISNIDDHLDLKSGTYLLAAGTTLSGLSDVRIFSSGKKATLKIDSGNFVIKSPSNVIFQNIHFEASSLDAVAQSIWVSNYTNIFFIDCTYSGFGGATANKQGSACIYAYAGDSTGATSVAGDSVGLIIDRCVFEGAGRYTSFGVRVYTEFGGSTATNVGGRITNSTFNEFNWNAVELAGPSTSGIIVAHCTANRCGLVPFDIDKGANNCNINNVAINRLLGNIDIVANPNTRMACAAISGVSPSGAYSYNNVVSNVTANLTTADLNAYEGRGCVAASMAYVQNSRIENVNVNIDGLPTRPSSSTFAFATVTYETISGCEFENITTNNATVGILETAIPNAGVGADRNYFRKIKNINGLKGECVSSINNGAVAYKHAFEDINFSTDMLDAITTANNSLVDLVATVSGSSIFHFKRCNFSCGTAGVFGINFSAVRGSFSDVNIDISAQANYFKTSSNGIRLHFGSNKYSGSPPDIITIFANLSGSCIAYGNDAPYSIGNYGTLANVPWWGSSIPSHPLIGVGQRVYDTGPVVGGTIGWILTTTAWKAFGNIAP